MDWVRSCYKTLMRVSDDPSAPLVEVQWYFVDDEPLHFLPFYTRFASGNWAWDHSCPEAWPGTGEVSPFPQDRKWVNGRRLWPSGNRKSPCGTPAQFAGVNPWPWTPEPVEASGRPVCCNSGAAFPGQLGKKASLSSTVHYEPAGVPCLSCAPSATPKFMYAQAWGWEGSAAWGWQSNVLNGVIIRLTQAPGFPCSWISDQFLIQSYVPGIFPPFHIRFELNFPPFTNTMSLTHNAVEVGFAFFGGWSKTDPALTCCPPAANLLPRAARFPPFVSFPAFANVSCNAATLPPHKAPPVGRLIKQVGMSSTVGYGRPYRGELSKRASLSSTVTFSNEPFYDYSGSLRKLASQASIDSYLPIPGFSYSGSLGAAAAETSAPAYSPASTYAYAGALTALASSNSINSYP